MLGVFSRGLGVFHSVGHRRSPRLRQRDVPGRTGYGVEMYRSAGYRGVSLAAGYFQVPRGLVCGRVFWRGVFSGGMLW